LISANALPQTPLGELTEFPRLLSWILGGPTSKRGKGMGRREDREKRKVITERKREGGTKWKKEGRGRETSPTNLNFWLRH